MTTKRLYNVTVEAEIVVLADSQQEAEKIAARLSRFDMDPWDTTARDFSHMPNDWDKDSIPFGDEDPANPDKTVGEWLEDGAAPEYMETLKALKKLGGK